MQVTVGSGRIHPPRKSLSYQRGQMGLRGGHQGGRGGDTTSNTQRFTSQTGNRTLPKPRFHDKYSTKLQQGLEEEEWPTLQASGNQGS